MAATLPRRVDFRQLLFRLEAPKHESPHIIMAYSLAKQERAAQVRHLHLQAIKSRQAARWHRVKQVLARQAHLADASLPSTSIWLEVDANASTSAIAGVAIRMDTGDCASPEGTPLEAHRPPPIMLPTDVVSKRLPSPYVFYDERHDDYSDGDDANEEDDDNEDEDSADVREDLSRARRRLDIIASLSPNMAAIRALRARPALADITQAVCGERDARPTTGLGWNHLVSLGARAHLEGALGGPAGGNEMGEYDAEQTRGLRCVLGRVPLTTFERRSVALAMMLATAHNVPSII
eukprot:CAMPEP_0115846320 /NCGR_PEP_ID=MMETSP0287-20121206/9802_1 /TAXON_ID=412157 /ORGANISM="Chrysochromulina rotalis, Strain UIO044" /LENGTH=292 /DNA_ID=CAMNT_0003300111 /DNA_START=30 /DNA_END=909 /DNA_ORIENTATION=-